MAVDILQKRSSVSAALATEQYELVTVGVHMDGKLSFSGGTQMNAVIVDEPPTLILTAASDPTVTRVFQVTFQVETPGWEYPEDGAMRLLVGSNHAGLQVPRDTPTEVTVLLFNGLKKGEKDLGTFQLGLQPSTTENLVDGVPPQITWHDPTILWEPPLE